MTAMEKSTGIKGYITDFKVVRISKGKFAFDVSALMIGDFLLVNDIAVLQLEEDGKFWIMTDTTANNIINLIELAEPLFLIQSVKEALK